MLKFPRTTLTDVELAPLEAFFKADLTPICEGSANLVSNLALSAAMRECLRSTSRTGCFTQGLELITKTLNDEKKGLDEVQKRTEQPAASRMSRLLFLSNDGSNRFYGQVDAVLKTHGNRVWCCRLDAASEDLGSLLGSRGNPIKAIMINDKKALAAFLETLSLALKS